MRKKTIFSEEYLYLIERLKDARIAAGLKQEDVAKKLGKVQSYVSKIETGERRVDVIELNELAKIYKKSLNYFIMK